jgi:hypothetical protein
MTVPGPDANSPPVLVRRSTIDDLDLFSPETKTSNAQMMDFLDRTVVDVVVQGARPAQRYAARASRTNALSH